MSDEFFITDNILFMLILIFPTTIILTLIYEIGKKIINKNTESIMIFIAMLLFTISIEMLFVNMFQKKYFILKENIFWIILIFISYIILQIDIVLPILSKIQENKGKHKDLIIEIAIVYLILCVLIPSFGIIFSIIKG